MKVSLRRMLSSSCSASRGPFLPYLCCCPFDLARSAYLILHTDRETLELRSPKFSAISWGQHPTRATTSFRLQITTQPGSDPTPSSSAGGTQNSMLSLLHASVLWLIDIRNTQRRNAPWSRVTGWADDVVVFSVDSRSELVFVFVSFPLLSHSQSHMQSKVTHFSSTHFSPSPLPKVYVLCHR